MSVTIEDIIGEVRKLAEEWPDRRYDGTAGGACSYVTSSDSPGKGCIFGMALKRLGFSRDAINKRISIDRLLRELDIEFSLWDARWCLAAQEQQDGGVPWGMCIDDADQYT